ncbi:DsbA family protein [Lentilactobacillus sp. SPB1-3]|uniref:DsbA family protein n=1 Tax=Lentilactobacillus terminaliae TaxID=3003483 RepID=A0ACD5DDA1_9LACO|nr:DsbA family protein [Lentilactobacillus sp. SPB1-3]MCZ0977813.1 DsbA family protein [Lentilactobacillus sp. SPB1-3]
MLLEIYLFVDPLDKQCYEAEKAVEKVARTLKSQLVIHFIPLLSINVLNDFKNPLKKRFHRSVPYDMVINYKAASFQGQRCGRNFLMSLQEQLFDEEEAYCHEIIMQTAAKQQLDLEMFDEDRQSKLVAETYHSDQVAAINMNITEPASAVLFNTRLEDSGIIIRDFNYESLLKYCQDSIKESSYLEEVDSENANDPVEHKIIKYADLKSL